MGILIILPIITLFSCVLSQVEKLQYASPLRKRTVSSA